jgi:hypothetical protein
VRGARFGCLGLSKDMTRLSASVTSVVFYSAGLAFIWVTTGYTVTGLLFYAGSMWAAHRLGWLQRLREWPLLSKIALVSGPPLVALGCFFSTRPPTYRVLIPFLIYVGLSMIGGLLLGRLNSDPE